MTDEVIPFGLYHHVDKLHHCNIVTPTKIKYKNGTYKYEVLDPIDKYWKSAGIFYAVNPLFRPIPEGMKLFCAKKNKHYPYNVMSIDIVYDVYDDSCDGTYFITYSTPVPNTIPIYTWISKNGAFADFDTSSPPSERDNPHTDTKLWHGTTINPIYVMNHSIMGPDYRQVKFMCNNGSCFPRASNEWIEKSRKNKDVGWTGPDIYNPNSIHIKPLPLYKCVVNCNELVRVKDGGGSPHDLINIIKGNQETLPNKFVINLSPLIISIIIFVFVVVIILVVYQVKL